MKSTMQALNTIAMLSVLQSNQKDYLSLIEPFILKLLSSYSLNSLIVAKKISKELAKNFGLVGLPVFTIEKIFNRFRKEKIVNVRNGQYYLTRNINSSRFDNDLDKLRRAEENVLDSLAEYFNENSIQYSSREDLSNRFLLFLDRFGCDCLRDIKNLRKITINKNANSYDIGRFILNEHSKQSDIFKDIINIIHGFMVYNAIYAFSDDTQYRINSFKTKFKGTQFIFDTNLLINLLGYDTEEGHTAVSEMAKMIKESGGIVTTFPMYIDEFRNILKRYARDKKSRPFLSLDKLRRLKYTENDALSLRNEVVNKLASIGVNVTTIPEFGNINESSVFKRKGIIDEVLLKETIETVYSKSKRYNNINNDEKIENDVRCISAVSLMRGEIIEKTLEGCNIIFVTPNYTLNRIIKEFNEDHEYDEVGLSILDNDLATLLWLKTGDKKNDLSKLKLLECAYAACMPTNEIMETFIKKISLLEKEGSITEDAAYNLRSNLLDVEKDIAHKTKNDPSLLDDKVVLDINNKFVEQATAPYKEEIKDLTKQVRIIEDKKDQAYKKAENESNLIEKKTKSILFGTLKCFSILLFAILLILEIYLFTLDDSILTAKIAAGIILIFNAFTLFDLFVSRPKNEMEAKRFKKWINIIAKKRKDKFYKKAIERINNYY